MATFPASVQAILARDYQVRTGDYLSRGWDIFRQNLGNFLAFGLLYFGLTGAQKLLFPEGGLSAGLWQFVGAIISPALAIGGVVVADKIARQEAHTFQDFFQGFQKFGRLTLTYLLMMLLIILVALPGLLFGLGGGLITFIETQDLSALSGIGFGLLLALIPIMYLGISYGFANQFIWFYDLGIWESLEASRQLVAKHWWGIFGFFLSFVGIVVAAMLVMLLAGKYGEMLALLLVYPWLICVVYVAFADITRLGKDADAPEVDIAEHFIPS